MDNEPHVDDRNRSRYNKTSYLKNTTAVGENEKQNGGRTLINDETTTERQDIIREKINSLVKLYTEEKVWFRTKDSCDSTALIQTKVSEKDPSLLCEQQPVEDELCYCMGGENSRKFRKFCGFCKPTFIPDSAKKGPELISKEIKETNSSMIILDLINKAKKRLETLSKEWTFMDENEGNKQSFIVVHTSEIHVILTPI